MRRLDAPSGIRWLRGLLECDVTQPIAAVYFLCDGDDVMYVGQTKNAVQRLTHHEQLSERPGLRIFLIAVDAQHLDAVEAAFIKRFNPPLNGKVGRGTWRGVDAAIATAFYDEPIHKEDVAPFCRIESTDANRLDLGAIRSSPVGDAQYLTASEAAQYLGVSNRDLAEWRERLVGPSWVQVSRGTVRYASAELVDWKCSALRNYAKHVEQLRARIEPRRA